MPIVSSTSFDNITFDGSILTYNNHTFPWRISEVSMEYGIYEPTSVTITGYSTGTRSYTIGTSNQKKEEVKKVDKSRGLFLGFVVDPTADELVYSSDRPFVAADEEHAKLKIVQKAGGSLSKEVDDYDIIILRLGKVRAKKEVQTVKVVKE